MKKILLFLVMLLNTAATFADTYTSGGVIYTYTVGEKTASVTDDDGTAIYRQLNGVVTIPESITPGTDGVSYTVTTIKKFNSPYLKSVTIPSSVTTINNSAFINSSNLTTVTFDAKSHLTTIDQGAFSGCTSLKSIRAYEYSGYASDVNSIPTSVTTIGIKAFDGCTSLASEILIPSSATSIGVGAFRGCTSLTKITAIVFNANFESDDGILFSSDKKTLVCFPAGRNVTSYEIPSTVTTIEISAFYGCSKLTSVTIPSSVTCIKNSAFCNCSALATVYLPQNTTVASFNPGGHYFENTSPNLKFYVMDGTGTYDLKNYTGATSPGWSDYAKTTNTFYYLPKTVTDAKIATLFLPYEVAIPEGIKAYYCAGISNGKMQLTQFADGVIPADTPAILTSDAATVADMLGDGVNSTAQSSASTLLKGASADITNETDKYLTLGMKTDSDPAEYGFYLYSGSTIAANTCYIEKSAATAKTITLSFDDGTTAIDAATATAEPAMKEYYDLQGRRVLNPTKGLYIVNGKKVVINQ